MSVTLDVDDEAISGLAADAEFAERPGLVPAPGTRRAAAFALDAAGWVVLSVPGIIGAMQLVGSSTSILVGDVAALPPGPIILLAVSHGLLVVFALVQLVLHGRRGLTLGKSALELRSVSVARVGAPGFRRVVLRALTLWASQLVLPVTGPAIMFASSSWDPQQRGRSWLDRIGGCYVVDVRRGLDPLAAASVAVQGGGAAAPSPAGPRWELVFDDGSRIIAAASGLLGRGPTPAPGEHVEQLVPLVDRSMRMSKTHATYGIDSGAFWLTDRGSKNGVTITLPDGATRTLAPRVPTPLRAGTRVRLGDRSFTLKWDTGMG
ncbi:RDD family protein [Agromyces sp. NPDC049794]|uniref:RDD family protein n=1 Tax=unclassified Agromyces TaxID=2639701 RepID=UPI0034013D20